MTSRIVPNIINEMCSFHEDTQAKRVLLTKRSI